MVIRMPEWKRAKLVRDAKELEDFSRESSDLALKEVLLRTASALKRVAAANVNR